MKTSLALLLFGLAAPAIAQDASNPFVKKAASNQPLPPAGPAFASVLEHFLVPPDLLDDWLRAHPLKDDATALRTAVQEWIAEGKAQIDHTALTLGAVSRRSTSESIMEKAYPTEYTPGGAGAWPWPTAFETRNLGHTLESGVTTSDGSERLWMTCELSEMLSSDSSQPLIEQTRQACDMFLPRVRSLRITQSSQNSPRDSMDPFASPTERSTPPDFTKSRGVAFAPGAYRLAGRFDPLFAERSSNQLTRLIFYRGDIGKAEAKPAIPAADVSRISYRIVRVPLPAFSAWLLDHSPLAATTEAWAAAESWREEGKAESVGNLSCPVRESVRNAMENIEEYIYPTEVKPGTDMELKETWEEGKQKNGKDGVATMSRYEVTPREGMEGAGLATAYETRNIGNTIESVVTRDDQGWLIQCDWELVRHLGDSVYHRIKVSNEWIPDIKMPLFTSSHLLSTIRVQPGQWTLLGSVSEYLETDKLDREHCLLVFVKVD